MSRNTLLFLSCFFLTLKHIGSPKAKVEEIEMKQLLQPRTAICKCLHQQVILRLARRLATSPGQHRSHGPSEKSDLSTGLDGITLAGRLETPMQAGVPVQLPHVIKADLVKFRISSGHSMARSRRELSHMGNAWLAAGLSSLRHLPVNPDWLTPPYVP